MLLHQSAPLPDQALCIHQDCPPLRLQLLAERIYWDQASVLAQLGLIDTAGGGNGSQRGMGGRGSMWSGASRLVASKAKEEDGLSGVAMAHRARLRDRLIACLPTLVVFIYFIRMGACTAGASLLPHSTPSLPCSHPLASRPPGGRCGAGDQGDSDGQWRRRHPFKRTRCEACQWQQVMGATRGLMRAAHPHTAAAQWRGMPRPARRWLQLPCMH